MSEINPEGDLHIPALERPQEEERSGGMLDDALDVDVDDIWKTPDSGELVAVADMDGELRSGVVIQPLYGEEYDALDFGGGGGFDDAIEFDDDY